MGEFDFLDAVQRLVEGGSSRPRLGRGVQVGIGDDCAVVSGFPRTLLTTDCQLEGVHFRRSWLTPRELGARAFRVAVSDIAAMGGRPRYVLLALELPVLSTGSPAFDAAAAKALVAGLAAEARLCGASLVGGNVSAASRLGLTVTVVGEAVHPALLRSGARAGDLVFVTGTIGGAAAALALLLRRSASQKPAATAAWRRPPLRVEVGAELGERGLVHSMIDVSDGLAQDLGHLCERSGVTVRVDPASLPLHRSLRGARRQGAAAKALAKALGGGEDYELAFTASPRRRADIEALTARHRCPVTVIGSVHKGPCVVVDPSGQPLASAAGGGFDHLLTRPSRRSDR